MIEDIPLTNSGFSDLNPLILGRENCEGGHSFGPAIREHVLIHYVIKGNGILYKNGNQYPVKKGELFIILPGEVTTYTADKEKPWDYIWVGFNGRLAEQFMSLNPPVQPFPDNTFFEMMDCKTLHNTKEAFIASRLFSIYCILFEKGTKSNNYEKTVCDYIRSNYMSKICIEDLANSIGLDRRYLSRVFKQKTGITIQQYLIKTRMEHAAALLNSDFPIAQTAAMCGYEDPFLFSRMFKKYFGVSPSHFQKYC